MATNIRCAGFRHLTQQPHCPRYMGSAALPMRPHFSMVSRHKDCSVRALVTADMQPLHKQRAARSTSSVSKHASAQPTFQQRKVFGQQASKSNLPDHKRVDVKRAYKAPTSDLPGVAAAAGLLTAWCLVFQHAVFQYDLTAPLTPWHLLEGVLSFAAMEFLSTGLFITTHDAMHSAVAPNNKLLNDIIGSLCISLYAWFDYSKMHVKHWEHHNECGTPGADPDFHKGSGSDSFPSWFADFMKTYVSIPQYVKLQLVSSGLMMGAHAPLPNLLLFWAGAGAVSAVRLFAFGTYLPHRPDQEAWEEGEPAGSMPWWRARSSAAPRWLSFLRCYHFDYHWEHHMWPTAPWWDLPKAKALHEAVVSGNGVEEAAAQHELVPVPVAAQLQRTHSGGVQGLVRRASHELHLAVSSLGSYGSMDLAFASVDL